MELFECLLPHCISLTHVKTSNLYNWKGAPNNHSNICTIISRLERESSVSGPNRGGPSPTPSPTRSPSPRPTTTTPPRGGGSGYGAGEQQFQSHFIQPKIDFNQIWTAQFNGCDFPNLTQVLSWKKLKNLNSLSKHNKIGEFLEPSFEY